MGGSGSRRPGVTSVAGPPPLSLISRPLASRPAPTPLPAPRRRFRQKNVPDLGSGPTPTQGPPKEGLTGVGTGRRRRLGRPRRRWRRQHRNRDSSPRAGDHRRLVMSKDPATLLRRDRAPPRKQGREKGTGGKNPDRSSTAATPLPFGPGRHHRPISRTPDLLPSCNPSLHTLVPDPSPWRLVLPPPPPSDSGVYFLIVYLDLSPSDVRLDTKLHDKHLPPLCPNHRHPTPEGRSGPSR